MSLADRSPLHDTEAARMHRDREREKEREREYGRSLNPVPAKWRRFSWGWQRIALVAIALLGLWYWVYEPERSGLQLTLDTGPKRKPGKSVGNTSGKTHVSVDVGYGDAGITREYDNIVIHLPAPPAPYSVPPVSMNLPSLSTPMTEHSLILTEQDKKDAAEPLDAENLKEMTRKLRRFYELYTIAETIRGHLANPTEDPDAPNTLLSSPLIDPFLRHTRVLEHILFPWVRPYHPSVKALVESFAYGGRGGVMCVGNGHVKQAVFLIRSLREVHKSTLPIEVWYIGDRDLGEKERGVLSAFPGVITRDITQHFDNSLITLEGWDVKPFAIMASGWREVIFMDADIVFLQSPDDLYKDPTYEKTGTLFYWDRRSMFGGDDSHSDFLKSFLPAPYSPEMLRNGMFTKETVHYMESGVVVIDKVKHWWGMLGVCKMNEKRTRDKVSYRKFHGDKETFWAGFEMAGDWGYAFSPHRAGAMGQLLAGDMDPTQALRNGKMVVKAGHEKNKNKKRVCALQLAHPDSAGKRIMWFNGGILRDKFVGTEGGPVAQFEVWTLEPARWELYEDNIACIYIDSPAQKLTHLTRAERILLRRLGHIWYDSLWQYHGIAKEKVKLLERETVSLDPVPDDGNKEENKDEEEKKDGKAAEQDTGDEKKRPKKGTDDKDAE